MKRTIVIPALMALALSACAAESENRYSFAIGRDFIVLGNSDQVYYVTGLADAFTYLSAKTGHQPGLSDCYRKYDVSRPELAITFEGYIDTPKAFNREYAGSDPKTLPTAEVFDQMSTLFCKDERTDTTSTDKGEAHSFETAKYLTIWSVADPAYYVAGLADAFAFLSARTGYRRGLSECYRKRYADRKELMASFRSYIKTPKAHDQAYAGPPLEPLPAAEVFDQFSDLYCKNRR